MPFKLPLLAFALSFVLAPAAAAVDFGEVWNRSTGYYEMAEFDGQPGLEMLVRGSTAFELRTAISGAPAYLFPTGYQIPGFGSFAANLDADASSELLVYSIAGISPSIMRVGFFDVVGGIAETGGGNPPPPMFGPRWEIPDYDGAIEEVRTGDFDANGERDLVVLSAANFRILDSSSGTTRFDWQADGPANRTYQTIDIVDLDQDGRDELIVTSTGLMGADFKMHVIQSTTALAVGDRTAFETRVLDVRNAPNPFSGPTTISFSVPAGGPAVVHVFDAAGRRVRTLVEERLAPGRHAITWDGRDDGGRAVGSGVYFYEAEAAGQRAARKMLRVR